MIKYSDDMCCVIPCPIGPEQLCEKSCTLCNVQAEFSDFCQWAKRKKLQLNEDKTKHIRFSLNPTPENRCSCDPLSVQDVSEIKILGLTFQKNGLFKKHVKNLLAHARSLLYLLKDMHHHCMPIDEVNRLFESVILSRVKYAISVYGCDEGALRKIDSFLHKCYLKQYSKQRINIHDILYQKDQRLLSKIMQNQQHPLRPYILSHKKSHTIDTRHNYFGVKPKTKTKFFLRTFCNRVLTA